MKRVIMGTEAAALGALLARVQVVAAYPITPQTVVMEELSDYIGRGELDGEFLAVESEHSAMAACVGASATGSRAFTATSSQGLALMHEMLHHAAGGRLPIVMFNANRALSPPWNLYCDHTDSLSQRDTGWIQYYCRDAQDVLDSTLIAYKTAEKVMLPVMLNMDGFYLTHTSEIVDVPDQADVDAFLPPYRPSEMVDLDRPSTYGAVCGADLYTPLKFRRQRDMLGVTEVWSEVSAEFAARFGREHPPVEAFMTSDAGVVIISIGTAAGAARMAADALRADGMAAGSLCLSLMRPFPAANVLESLSTAEHVVVLDRDVSFGAEGIVAQEVKACLYGKSSAAVHGLITGIGGVDVTAKRLAEAVRSLAGRAGAPQLLGQSFWDEVTV